MLKKLTGLDGVSGNEDAVREYILERITPYADEIRVDTMGNVIAHKNGKSPNGKRVIVAAHMDEVGLIISGITDDGFLKFKSVGGIDERMLLTQRVRIGKNALPGVIGVKAVHLQEKEERKKVIKEKALYIDIGATSKEDAERVVSLGDYAAFDSPYRKIGDCIKAKALDDRIGCMLLMEAIQKTYSSDMDFCFTVQEETGVRGSAILAHRLEADLALIVESTTAADVPFLKPHEVPSRFGGGPVISVLDRGSVADPAFIRFLKDLAEREKLHYQWKQTTAGGNDARSFASSGGSCRVAAISAPCRYIHSPVSMVYNQDLLDMRKFLQCTLDNLEEFWKSLQEGE